MMLSKRTLCLAVLLVFALIGMVEAGHYQKDNHAIYLDGKVKINFETLYMGWSRDYQAIDTIRYRMNCLHGEAILNNVEYIDDAVEGHETVRWSQSNVPMNLNFSAKPSHLDKHHITRVFRNLKVKIAPYNAKKAKIRFHIFASGRNYKVTWSPFTGEVSAIW
jgi:hypothetical protein